METIKKNMNKIIIGIVLIFIVTFAYNYISKEEGVEVVEEQVAEDDKAARKIIEALNELDKINIDYKFFTQNISENSNLISFSELHDFSEKELREKEMGKNNPFISNSSLFISNSNPFVDTVQTETIQPVEQDNVDVPSTNPENNNEEIFELEEGETLGQTQ